MWFSLMGSWDRISVEGLVLENILSDTFESFRVVAIIMTMEPNGPYWMSLIHQRKKYKKVDFSRQSMKARRPPW